MNALPEDFSEIAHIETLSISVTKLEMEEQAIAYANTAGLSLDDRLALGMRIAVNRAKLMRARHQLKDAQEAFASAKEVSK
jgi:hypothetical protein